MAVSANPDIAVVIPARKDRDHVSRLVAALLRGFVAHRMTSEIMVVANGGDDGTGAICERLGVGCMAHEDALTPAAARNIGARHTSAEWLAFLDADVEPLDTWFSAVRELTRFGDATLAAGWEVLVPPGAGWLPQAWQHVRMAAAQTQRYINTGNLVMTRTLFERAGGFDATRLAGEDAEFGDRIVAAGGGHVFNPGLAVLHHGEPRDVRDFFRRQMFHSEPLGTVLRAPGAPLNLAIAAILTATVAGAVATPWVWRHAAEYAWIALLAGPAVLLAMAVAKAAAGFRRTIRLPEFGLMVAACAVMLTARTVGTVRQLRSWRS